MKTTGVPKNIDEYISSFPLPVQKKLKEIRRIIKNAAPGAEEKISYQMPAFALKGILVYFAAQTHHIGFYPTSSGVKSFIKELSGYKTGKGTIQFPLDKPLPADLIRRIVIFRINENLVKAEIKAAKKRMIYDQ
jgi:uncharacterized protein YdhG (YjbR/CyaY superfamily)